MYGTKDGMENYKAELASNIASNLSNAVIFTFKAQGHHWNVEGMKFHMFHEFFGEIYEDVRSSIDPMAENLLKMGIKAPFTLIEFAKYADIADPEAVCSDALMMLEDLCDSNEVFIDSLTRGFELAEKCREYGLADFLGGRIDMHKKWQWQLNAHKKDYKKSY